MPAADDFATRLLTRVLAATHRNAPGVEGAWGMVERLPVRRRALDAAEAVARRGGLARRHFVPEAAGAELAGVVERLEGLAHTERLLADQASRDLLVEVLVARVLGPHHADLPMSQSAFRAACAALERDHREARAVARSPEGAPLDRFTLPARNGPVTMVGLSFLGVEFFGEEQYAHDGVRAKPGDVVVDAGCGWGETALYFADAVGPEGRVVAFEFVPANLELIERNRTLNPRLADRIEVIPHPTWDEQGSELRYAPAGGQTSVAAPAPGATETVTTETIDHAVSDPVGFIKLDVEGAEQATLRGAEQTIRRSRPGLAVSIYHDIEDFVAIPAWIDGLDLGYRFSLGHLWPGIAETILFAHVP